MNIIISHHARLRMKQRCITLKDITNTITYGNMEPSEENKAKYSLDPFVIVTVKHENDTLLIVTVHYTSVFNHQARKLCRKHKISTKKAIKIIRGID